MTKLSEVRAEFEKHDGGHWVRFRGTIYLKVRGETSREYRRAQRLAQFANPDLNGSSTPEQKVAREEAVGAALVPAAAEHLLVDWWGMDAEVEPIAIENPPQTRVVADVDGEELLALEHGGKVYRPEGELWQEVVPYSAALARQYLADPACVELLNTVRITAKTIDQLRLMREVEALGKPRSSSSGKSTTASTPRK